MSECPWPGCDELPTVTVVEPPEGDDAVAAGTTGAPAGRYCPEHAQRVRDGDAWDLDETERKVVETDVEWISGTETEVADD
ncbi:hypothetical protein [Halobaculum gomorrense]|uniref:Uncharacterized protein n=1 Tax=Halobaculum gomorrense TaxID=43928 RepID=A0A1M5MKX2_9EURY|nr:hypothetical protein [Halobaculum gomorrense]SHG78030.1 hypothetical protein SAMN05443636_1052 [Halobaculum gomorrense]